MLHRQLPLPWQSTARARLAATSRWRGPCLSAVSVSPVGGYAALRRDDTRRCLFHTTSRVLQDSDDTGSKSKDELTTSDHVPPVREATSYDKRQFNEKKRQRYFDTKAKAEAELGIAEAEKLSEKAFAELGLPDGYEEVVKEEGGVQIRRVQFVKKMTLEQALASEMNYRKIAETKSGLVRKVIFNDPLHRSAREDQRESREIAAAPPVQTVEGKERRDRRSARKTERGDKSNSSLPVVEPIARPSRREERAQSTIRKVGLVGPSIKYTDYAPQFKWNAPPSAPAATSVAPPPPSQESLHTVGTVTVRDASNPLSAQRSRTIASALQPLAPTWYRGQSSQSLLLLVTPATLRKQPLPGQEDAAGWVHSQLMTRVVWRLFQEHMPQTPVETFRVVVAVVDKLPAGLGTEEGGCEGLEGLAYALLDDLETHPVEVDHKTPVSEPGLGADKVLTLRLSSSPDAAPPAAATTTTAEACTLQLPLANTVFQTGGAFSSLLLSYTYSSLPHPDPKAKYTRTLRTEERPVEIQSATATLRIPGLAAGDVESLLNVKVSTPLVPLTEPRKVEAAMGNIVRQLRPIGEDGEEVVIRASAELEDAVNALVKSEALPAGPVAVWSLIIPSHVQNSHFVQQLIPSPTPITADTDTKDFPDLTQLLKAGARLHRVMSGGGGWGKKAGLLSLSPAVGFATTATSALNDSETSENLGPDGELLPPWMRTEAQNTDSTSGRPVEQGDWIQFFLALPHANTANNITEAGGGMQVHIGAIPSSVDALPISPADALSRPEPDGHPAKLTPNLFGVLSEKGFALEMGKGRSMVDVPFASLRLSGPAPDTSTEEPNHFVIRKHSYGQHHSPPLAEGQEQGQDVAEAVEANLRLKRLDVVRMNKRKGGKPGERDFDLAIPQLTRTELTDLHEEKGQPASPSPREDIETTERESSKRPYTVNARPNSRKAVKDGPAIRKYDADIRSTASISKRGVPAELAELPSELSEDAAVTCEPSYQGVRDVASAGSSGNRSKVPYSTKGMYNMVAEKRILFTPEGKPIIEGVERGDERQVDESLDSEAPLPIRRVAQEIWNPVVKLRYHVKAHESDMRTYAAYQRAVRQTLAARGESVTEPADAPEHLSEHQPSDSARVATPVDTTPRTDSRFSEDVEAYTRRLGTMSEVELAKERDYIDAALREAKMARRQAEKAIRESEMPDYVEKMARRRAEAIRGAEVPKYAEPTMPDSRVEKVIPAKEDVDDETRMTPAFNQVRKKDFHRLSEHFLQCLDRLLMTKDGKSKQDLTSHEKLVGFWRESGFPPAMVRMLYEYHALKPKLPESCLKMYGKAHATTTEEAPYAELRAAAARLSRVEKLQYWRKWQLLRQMSSAMKDRARLEFIQDVREKATAEAAARERRDNATTRIDGIASGAADDGVDVELLRRVLFRILGTTIRVAFHKKTRVWAARYSLQQEKRVALWEHEKVGKMLRAAMQWTARLCYRTGDAVASSIMDELAWQKHNHAATLRLQRLLLAKPKLHVTFKEGDKHHLIKQNEGVKLMHVPDRRSRLLSDDTWRSLSEQSPWEFLYHFLNTRRPGEMPKDGLSTRAPANHWYMLPRSGEFTDKLGPIFQKFDDAITAHGDKPGLIEVDIGAEIREHFPHLLRTEVQLREDLGMPLVRVKLKYSSGRVPIRQYSSRRKRIIRVGTTDRNVRISRLRSRPSRLHTQQRGKFDKPLFRSVRMVRGRTAHGVTSISEPVPSTTTNDKFQSAWRTNPNTFAWELMEKMLRKKVNERIKARTALEQEVAVPVPQVARRMEEDGERNGVDYDLAERQIERRLDRLGIRQPTVKRLDVEALEREREIEAWEEEQAERPYKPALGRSVEIPDVAEASSWSPSGLPGQPWTGRARSVGSRVNDAEFEAGKTTGSNKSLPEWQDVGASASTERSYIPAHNAQTPPRARSNSWADHWKDDEDPALVSKKSLGGRRRATMVKKTFVDKPAKPVDEQKEEKEKLRANILRLLGRL